MGIPQNEELFNHVIKYANNQAKEKAALQKGGAMGKGSVEAQIENEISAIRDKLKAKVVSIKEPNHLEFI